MGRAFEYRKATKLKRWGHMAKTFTRLGKQIAIAVKAAGPEPEHIVCNQKTNGGRLENEGDQN